MIRSTSLLMFICALTATACGLDTGGDNGVSIATGDGGSAPTHDAAVADAGSFGSEDAGSSPLPIAIGPGTMGPQDAGEVLSVDASPDAAAPVPPPPPKPGEDDKDGGKK